MRRVLLPATFVLGVAAMAVGAGMGVAAAAPAGKPVCKITDDRLRELSGLVATKTGYIAVNDSTDQAIRKRVFYLSKSCQVQNAVRYGGDGPRDPEDLAVSPNGKTLWIADTGDNIDSPDPRTSIVLWTMPIAGTSSPVLHRLAYPDGRPRDAEALLISGTGTPVIITKSPTKAELFVPAGPLQTANSRPVRLKAAGTLELPKSSTPNPLSVLGRVTITGAARSSDGKKIALRTYADAFEWDLVGGDVVKTLTSGTAPRITPLADPFGEAISYSPDGKQFLTVSDGGQLADTATIDILSYPPVAAAVKPTAGPPPPGGEGGGGSWISRLSLQDITYLVGAVGLVGTVLVAAGIIGIVRARRPSGSGAGRSGDGPEAKIGRQAVPAVESWDDPDRSFGHDPEPVGGGARSGGAVYGGSTVAPPVYGNGPGRTGGVYDAGNVYGSGGYRADDVPGPDRGFGSGSRDGSGGLGGGSGGGSSGSGGDGYGHGGWADDRHGGYAADGWSGSGSYDSGVPRARRSEEAVSGRPSTGYPDNGLRYH